METPSTTSPVESTRTSPSEPAVEVFPKCGHPKTPENTYLRKWRPTWQGYCKICARASVAKRKQALPPRDKDRLEERMAELVANGRCEVCDLLLPCGGHPSAAVLAHNRRPIVMPPPYNGD